MIQYCRAASCKKRSATDCISAPLPRLFRADYKVVLPSGVVKPKELLLLEKQEESDCCAILAIKEVSSRRRSIIPTICSSACRNSSWFSLLNSLSYYKQPGKK